MRKYETIFILQPELSEDEIKSVTAKAQDVISSYNGECLRMDDWGIRKLAYPIKKSQKFWIVRKTPSKPVCFMPAKSFMPLRQPWRTKS